MALNITDSNFDEIAGSGKPFVIDFWAEWCGPCRSIAPSIEELAEEFEGKVNVCKCNVDENNDLAVKFSVRSIPTVVFIQADGKVMDKQVGAASKDVFKEKIETLL